MAKMKNGNETTVKVEKNTKGRRTQKLLINTEEMWSDDVLIDSRQLPKRTSHKKRGRFETNNSICSNPKVLSRAISVDNFEVSQCGKNEDFEEAENTCSQNPPCPMKVSIVKKERKHLTNKSETLQINEKIFAKPRLIIATMKPFGLRIVRSNSAPTVNVSIQHIQKWKMKMRTQSKQQSEDIPRKRISVPIDSHLENSNNNVVKAWIHQKNMLLRKEREAKRKQRRLERAEHKRQEIDHQKRQRESEEKVKTWMEKKNINRIQKNMKINNCMISLGTGANTQNANPVVNGVRKSVNQSSAKTLKTEKQITEDNLEMNKKRVLILGTEKSKTEIMSSRPSKDLSKDQVTSSCKMEATLVQDSQHGSQESQKSNSKKVQKIKLVHQEIKQKAFSKSTSFRMTKRDTPSSGNTPQIKGLDNGNCRRGMHLIHRLPFNEWLSRKSKESKEIRAKMKEQETELDKDFQNIVPKLASKRIQNKMDSKKRVNTGKEFDRLANISLVSEFTGVTQNPKWLQEAIVTPAVKNWFVHRMEENLHDVSGNSSIQDDQKVQLKTSYSLYGKPYKAAEERSKALKQGHILRDKEVGENLEETLSDLNAKLC